jgi:hypothetical protein
MAGLKLGTTDISAINLGTTKVNKVYQGTNLIADYSTPSGVSPEAQAVLDRMTSLSQAESDAIVTYVDNIVAGNMWDRVEEIYCFGLNEADSLTGFKSRVATIQKPSEWTHSKARGWVTNSADTVNAISTNIIPSTMWNAGANLGSMGVYVTDNNYTGTSNQDFFGVRNSGLELYLRSRGSDTNDANILFMYTTQMTRPSWPQSELNNCLLSIGTTAYATAYDAFYSRYDGVNSENVYNSVSVFEGAPTIEAVINARNDGGTMQNSRQTGYGLYFCMNQDFPESFYSPTAYDYYDFRADTIQFLKDVGVTGVP